MVDIQQRMAALYRKWDKRDETCTLSELRKAQKQFGLAAEALRANKNPLLGAFGQIDVDTLLCSIAADYAAMAGKRSLKGAAHRWNSERKVLRFWQSRAKADPHAKRDLSIYERRVAELEERLDAYLESL